jgi:hypothetical protein
MYVLYACKMVARVSVPFTGGHYYGREERPNTELADNSLSARRKSPLTLEIPSLVEIT